MKYGHRIGNSLWGALFASMLYVAGGSASAAPLDLSTVPLFLSTGAEPNVMIMVDNSGSMSNIVPDAPYNASTVYLATCPTTNSNQVAATTQVRVSVSGTGAPRIRLSTDGYATEYVLNTGPGTTPPRRCFVTGSTYLASLYNDGAFSYLPSQYTGNYLNWYFSSATDPTPCATTWTTGGRKPCSKTRLMIAKTAGASLVDTMGTGMRAGLSTYNSADGGLLLEPVDSLTLAKRTSLKTKINAMVTVGQTPLAETLADIGFYFSRGTPSNLQLHPGGTPANVARSTVFDTTGYTRSTTWTTLGSNPVQYSCQKSFAVMLTDGRPQGDRDVGANLRDYTGDCASGLCDATKTTTNLPAGPLPNTSSQNGTKAGHSYEQQGSDYLDDVAAALYDIDLRPDLVSTTGIKNNLASYFISFADDQAIADPLMASAASRGGGEFFIAGNEAELTAAFNSAFTSIVRRTSSASAVATNSTRLDTNTLIYQARFRSDDWTGQLIAYALNIDGSVGAEQWDQDDLIPAEDDRVIFTKSSSGAVEFRWANLDSTQQAALNLNTAGATDTLGDRRVAWMRGDRAQEVQNGGVFRNRSAVLGDIVNSDPHFVGAQNFGYDALPAGTPGRSTYKTYRQSKVSDDDGDGIFVADQPMLYVGANDGMLHGFDAQTGLEQFAYVPSTVIPDLHLLPDPAYQHRYFVDGQAVVGDAYVDTGSGTADWASILVASAGAGSKVVFSLDVTDPHNFAAGDVLWEFTDADLGYVLGQGTVARMADGTWVAVFGNGYNSTNHHAVLYIVSLEDGTILKKIDTGVGDSTTPNGLATPSLLADGTRTIRAIYAGDLQGNLWKFDVSDASPTNWGIAYGGTPLFVAKDASGVRQPITAPAEIGRHPSGGYMIYFGTGKYFENGDKTVTSTSQIQSFYGIWDRTSSPSAITYTARSDVLEPQTIQYEGTPTGSHFPVRVTSQNTVNWTNKRGWYLDLDSPAIVGSEGERVVSLPILRNGRVIFTTLIPSSQPCDFGGHSWLMEITAVSGARLVDTPLDINEDGNVNDGDRVSVTIAGSPVTVSVSGLQSGEGIIDTPAIVDVPGTDGEIKVASGTSGNVENVRERGAGEQARGSWRQLR